MRAHRQTLGQRFKCRFTKRVHKITSLMEMGFRVCLHRQHLCVVMVGILRNKTDSVVNGFPAEHGIGAFVEGKCHFSPFVINH